jgi:gas vesicle protein
MNKDTLPRGLYFLAGAAAGAALGIYLNSEKGSALREQLIEHWENLLNTLGEGAQEKMDELIVTLNQLLEKGLRMVDDLEEEIEEEIEETNGELLDLAEEAESAFEAGMAKAKARMQQKLANAGLKRER